jgi:hypothetical protein
MPDVTDNAKSAVHIGTVLALAIQEKQSLSEDEFDGIQRVVSSELRKMGVTIGIRELDIIDNVPLERAMSIVISVRNNLSEAIGGACDKRTAKLFDLAFDLTLASTAPGSIAEVEDELNHSATEIGFKKATFSRVLDSAKHGSENAITEFNKAVDQLLSETGVAQWSDTVELKFSLGGASIDLKKVLRLLVNRFRARRHS